MAQGRLRVIETRQYEEREKFSGTVFSAYTRRCTSTRG